MNEFYVYVHRRASDGAIFYVGKGSAGRAWYFYDRSEWWHRVHDKHGITVEICQDNMPELDAYLLEMWLIAKFRHEGVKIVNMTDGGDAPPIHFGKAHPNHNPAIVRLIHTVTGEKFTGTQMEFLRKYNASQGNFSEFIAGRYKSLKGWIKEGVDPASLSRCGKNHPAYDQTIYEFEHLDGQTFSGTRYEFREQTGISALMINAFIRGVNHTLKGWFFAHRKGNLPPGNVGVHNNKHDPRVFKFKHKNGSIFVGTGLAFRKAHNIDHDGVYRLKIGKSRTSYGWSLVEEVVQNV